MVEKIAYWQEGIRRYSHQAIRIGSGKCNVCGELAEYFLEKPGASLRENYCSKCGATRATRDLAQVVLGTRGLDRNGSLATQRSDLTGISILAMPVSRRIHHVLKGLPGYECVELTAVEPAEKTLCPNERIKSFRLNHPDNHFDLVISENILQRFEGLSLALLEIDRVLKPDGHHVFTVPVVARCTSATRAKEAAENDQQRPLPVHPRGVPALAESKGYTDFGVDLTAAVDAIETNLETASFTRFYQSPDEAWPTGDTSGHGPEIGGEMGREPEAYPYKNPIVFRSRKSGNGNGHTEKRTALSAGGRLTGKELVLHIGTPKTATSYLQSFFAENVGELSANGIHYPAMVSIEESAAGVATSGNAFLLAQSLLDEKDPRKIKGLAAEAAWSKFERVLDGSSQPKILLSSEYFYIAPKEAYAKIREVCDQKGYQCRVIVYMRRQDHFLQSQYAQYVKKAAGNQTEEQFREEHSNLGVFQFHKRRNLIAAVIGIENCIVRPYEKDQFQGGNIGLAVLYALGVRNISGFILLDSFINKSPFPLELEILRYINANNPAPSGQFSLGLIQALQQVNHAEPRSGDGLISPRLRHKIAAKFESENCEIARRYLGREDGRLFLESLPEPSDAWQAPMPIPDSPGVQALARMAVALCNEVLELRRKK